MPITADDPFRNICTISRDGFVAAMRDRPASTGCLTERDCGEYWEACRSYAVDPNLILGMFAHESNMGKAGSAVQTKSWGNTRSPSLGSIPIDEIPGRTGSFPVFSSWLDGVLSTAGRLASPIWPHVAPYGERNSILEIFEHESGAVWAPLGDSSNDPDSYLGRVLDSMNRWTDIDAEWIAATRAPSPPILATWLPGSHTKGRGGRRALCSVLHVTQGASAGSAWNWWLNIANSANPSSAHYIIDRDRYGTIWTCVREADTAWANGILMSGNLDKALVRRWTAGGINPNAESVSVEVAGYSPQQPNADPNLNGYTAAQWASLEFLLPSIADRWGLAIDAESVLGHADIDGINRKNCPGLNAEEWQRVYSMDEPTNPMPLPTDDELLDIRWQEAQEIVGEKVAAALLTRPWVEGGTTKVLRCMRGWVGQTDEIEARLVDDTETMLTGAGYLQRL